MQSKHLVTQKMQTTVPRAGAKLSPLDPRDVILDHVIQELIVSSGQTPASLASNVNQAKTECKLFATHNDITRDPHDGLRKPVSLFDQGQTSMCVASTCATIMNLQQGIFNVNPYFVYNCRDSQQHDDGMPVKNCMAIAYRYGAPTFSNYPVHQTQTNPNGQPHIQVTPTTLENAKKQRFMGYGRVMSLQTAIDLFQLNACDRYKDKFGGLFFVLPVRNGSPRFWAWSPVQSVMGEDDDNASIVGYHCITVLDVDIEQKVFKLQNSWGVNWGNYGCTYFPFEDWIEYVQECWFATCSEEIANLIKTQVQKLNTFQNMGNGDLNPNSRQNVVYNMSTLNKEMNYPSQQPAKSSTATTAATPPRCKQSSPSMIDPFLNTVQDAFQLISRLMPKPNN